jgi:hypothetical protein
MGYDRSNPQALIYGPTKFDGFRVQHLSMEMLSMKIDTVIVHLRANTQLGKAFCINLNYLQLTAGITEPVLESSIPLTYIDNNCILHLRQICIGKEGKLEIQKIWIP